MGSFTIASVADILHTRWTSQTPSADQWFREDIPHPASIILLEILGWTLFCSFIVSSFMPHALAYGPHAHCGKIAYATVWDISVVYEDFSLACSATNRLDHPDYPDGPQFQSLLNAHCDLGLQVAQNISRVVTCIDANEKSTSTATVSLITQAQLEELEGQDAQNIVSATIPGMWSLHQQRCLCCMSFCYAGKVCRSAQIWCVAMFFAAGRYARQFTPVRSWPTWITQLP